MTPKEGLLDCNKELYRIICERESVCVSIKRRSVIVPELSEIYGYDIAYFYHAVDYIKERVENPVFIVFSDDIEWCKENFNPLVEIYYESGNDPIWEKVRLMSSCNHFIIHNSTFSWWAQHLSRNKDKIVVSPVKWMNRDDQPIDIYEDRFVYIDNGGKIFANHL